MYTVFYRNNNFQKFSVSYAFMLFSKNGSVIFEEQVESYDTKISSTVILRVEKYYCYRKQQSIHKKLLCAVCL